VSLKQTQKPIVPSRTPMSWICIIIISCHGYTSCAGSTVPGWLRLHSQLAAYASYGFSSSLQTHNYTIRRQRGIQRSAIGSLIPYSSLARPAYLRGVTVAGGGGPL
jgi:hypothetical protein